MKAPSMTIDRKQKTATIVMPLEKARPSKATGKTMLIASTRGNRTSTETYAHRPVCFTANVFFYPAKPVLADGVPPEFISGDEGATRPRKARGSPKRSVRKKRNAVEQEPMPEVHAPTGSAVANRGGTG
jgi:hypothetical protein